MRFQVEGKSMEPAVRQDERVLVFTWAYAFSKPKEGDLIVCYDPKEAKRKLLKRVIRISGLQIWVEGDNKKSSTDSREFGPIAKKNILGKVLLRYKYN